MLHLLAPGLAAKVADRGIRIVVEIKRMLLEFIEEQPHALEIFRRQLPLLESPRVHAEKARDGAVHDFLLGHFEREDGDVFALDRRSVTGNVEREARLADARASGNGDETSRRQAGEHLVEIAKACGEAKKGGLVVGFMEAHVT